MKFADINHFLHRGGKLTALDALWFLILTTAIAALGWSGSLTSIELLFCAFAFLTSILIPWVLQTGFFHARSSMRSPYEAALRRVQLLTPIARVIALLGLALIATNVPHTSIIVLVFAASFVGIGGLLFTNFLRQARRYQSWIRDFLENYDAEFVLHTPRPDGGSYQVQMWLEPLAELKRRYIIVVRSAEALKNLAPITDVPILVCESWADLDLVMTPQIRAVFYVNSVGSNADLLTYRSAKHVYLGHGESEKPLSVHPLHAAFDYIAVAGQAAIDRYANAGVVIPEEKFIRIGRPQLTGAVSKFAGKAFESDKPSVLYAPTWKGYNALSSYSSLSVGKELVTRLVEAGYRVVFRPHPFSLQRPAERALCEEITAYLQAKNSAGKTVHLFGPELNAAAFTDMMHLGDALIADRSSVIIDFLSTSRPIAEIEFNGSALQTLSEANDYTYRVSRSLQNLEPVLNEMLGADSLSSARNSAAEYYLGLPTGQTGFAAALHFLFR